MSVNQFLWFLDEAQRHENRQLADLITAVNQGSHAKPDDLRRLLHQLRHT